MKLFSFKDSVDPGEACPCPNGDIIQYQIYFQSGPVVVTDNVSITRCISGRCSHTFKPPSNPPSSYDSVSVAAENVIGVGATKTCTQQLISKFLYNGCLLKQFNILPSSQPKLQISCYCTIKPRPQGIFTQLPQCI